MFNTILVFVHYLYSCCFWGDFLTFQKLVTQYFYTLFIRGFRNAIKVKAGMMRSGMYDFTLQKKGQVVDNNKVIVKILSQK